MATDLDTPEIHYVHDARLVWQAMYEAFPEPSARLSDWTDYKVNNLREQANRLRSEAAELERRADEYERLR